jgi:uncharacterized protein with NRDE domain
MCTLHLFYRVSEEEPVLFAANRDENLDRAWTGPSILSAVPGVFGPRDATAGGTWLGVSSSGLLVSLANHKGTLANGASLCSRGHFVFEVLRRGTAAQAQAFAAATAPLCKAFTLLLADPAEAFVLENGPRGCSVFALEPGCHVITNAPFRDPLDRKAHRSLRRMERLRRSSHLGTKDLFAFLCDHESEGPEPSPLCVHPAPAERFGTSSASVVRIGAAGQIRGFHFSPGPPCSTDWLDHTAGCRAALEGAPGTSLGKSTVDSVAPDC